MKKKLKEKRVTNYIKIGIKISKSIVTWPQKTKVNIYVLGYFHKSFQILFRKNSLISPFTSSVLNLFLLQI